jgi:hypothetical protein
MGQCWCLPETWDRCGHLFLSDDHRKAMNGIARELF